MLIQGLPVDVKVLNASGMKSVSVPFVQHNFPVPASANIDFLIEYYRPSRVPFASPAFEVEETPAAPNTANGTILQIDPQRAPMQGGRFLIEFPVIPGGRYAVQYSSDLMVWKTANPILLPTDNRVQWYDDGPPKTESIPSNLGSRFYRVIQLP